MFIWCQPRWSVEPLVEASMALIGGFTSFPIVFMIIVLKMIKIIVISTCRIIALLISVPLVFEWSKSGLKRARTIEFTEIPLNRLVLVNRAVYFYWAGSGVYPDLLNHGLESGRFVGTGGSTDQARVGLQRVGFQNGPF